jgi:hypothetical protein
MAEQKLNIPPRKHVHLILLCSEHRQYGSAEFGQISRFFVEKKTRLFASSAVGNQHFSSRKPSVASEASAWPQFWWLSIAQFKEFKIDLYPFATD